MWCTLLTLLHMLVFSGSGQTIPDSLSSNPKIIFAVDYTRRGQPELAERQYDAAIRESAKGDPLTHGHILNMAAASFHEIGNFPRAETCLRKSLEIWRKQYGADHIALIPIVNRLACVYIETGESGKAQRLQLETWVERVAQQMPGSDNHVNLLGTLATLNSQKRRYTEAERFSKTALDLLASRGEQESMDSVAMVNNLGLVSLESGNFDQAELYLQRANRLLQKSATGHPFYSAVNRTLLARVYQKKKRYAEAERLLTEAITMMELRCGAGSLRTALLLVEYSNLLREQKRKDEARRVELRARAIVEASGMSAFSARVDAADLRR